jgi:hypothetical protein
MFKIEKFVHSIAAKHYDRRAQIDAARAQRAKSLSEISDRAEEKDVLAKKHIILESRAKTAAIHKDYHEALSTDGYDTICKKEEDKNHETQAEPESITVTIDVTEDEPDISDEISVSEDIDVEVTDDEE